MQDWANPRCQAAIMPRNFIVVPSVFNNDFIAACLDNPVYHFTSAYALFYDIKCMCIKLFSLLHFFTPFSGCR